jgi:hypothetical protein
MIVHWLLFLWGFILRPQGTCYYVWLWYKREWASKHSAIWLILGGYAPSYKSDSLVCRCSFYYLLFVTLSVFIYNILKIWLCVERNKILFIYSPQRTHLKNLWYIYATYAHFVLHEAICTKGLSIYVFCICVLLNSFFCLFFQINLNETYALFIFPNKVCHSFHLTTSSSSCSLLLTTFQSDHFLSCTTSRVTYSLRRHS